MALCVVIGTGPVGEYVASQIREVEPTTKFIGLSATRPWLSKIIETVHYVAPNKWGELLAAIKSCNASEVIFAGEGFWTLRSYADKTARYYLTRNLFTWFPHGYFLMADQMLKENGIEVVNILQYLPMLCAETGLSIGLCNGYDPIPDFRATKDYVQKQSRRTICQTVIVDQAAIIDDTKEIGGTTRLIEKFGRSTRRTTSTFPVLCKIAVEPFGKIAPPTIGGETLMRCAKNGIRAIVIEGGKSVLMNRAEVVQLAAQYSICVFAVG